MATLTKQDLQRIIDSAPKHFTPEMKVRVLDNLLLKNDISDLDPEFVEERRTYFRNQLELEKPFVEEAGQDFKSMGQNLKTTFDETKQTFADIDEAKATGVQSGFKSFGQKVGAALGGISKGIGNIATGAIKAVLPQGAENTVKEGVGEAAGAVIENTPLKELIENYAALAADQSPEAQSKKRDIDSLLGIASFATDIAGGGIGGKAGAKAGTMAVKAGEKVVGAPMGFAGKVIGRTGDEVLGFSTGAGREVIDQTFREGEKIALKTSAKELVPAFIGRTSKEDIVNNFNDVFNVIRNKRGAEYRAGLEEIGKQTDSLDISPVLKTFDDQLKEFNITRMEDGAFDFSRSSIQRPTEQAAVEKILNTLEDWGSRAGDRTPVGVDQLKKIVDNFIPESGAGSKFGAEVKNSVRKILNDQVPGYQELTKNYHDLSNLMDELTSSLGVGPNKNVETAITKITNALSANKEYRQALVEQMEEIGNVALKDQLAGAALSTWLPKGLVSRLFAGGAIGSTQATLGSILAGVAATLPFFSPKIVGSLLLGLGYAKGKIGLATEAVKLIMEKLGKGAGAGTGAAIIPALNDQASND